MVRNTTKLDPLLKTDENKILERLRVFTLALPLIFISFLWIMLHFTTEAYKKEYREAFARLDSAKIKNNVRLAIDKSVSGYIQIENEKLQLLKEKNPNKEYKDLDVKKLDTFFRKNLNSKDIIVESSFSNDRFIESENGKFYEFYNKIKWYNLPSILNKTVYSSVNMFPQDFEELFMYNKKAKKTKDGTKYYDVTFNEFITYIDRNEYGHRQYEPKVDAKGRVLYGRDLKIIPQTRQVKDINQKQIEKVNYYTTNKLKGLYWKNFFIFLLGFTTLFIAGYLLCTKREKVYTLHGDAKWSESFDLIFSHHTKKIYEMDLINTNDGIILGKFKAPFHEYEYFEKKPPKFIQNLRDKYKLAREFIKPIYSGQRVIKRHYKRIFIDEFLLLRDNNKTHLVLNAPTRQGKGVSIIVPSLYEYTQSVFVLDIKGENYQLSGYVRKNKWHNTIMRFAPKSDNSSGFNPLREIRMLTPKEAEDVQNIVNILSTKDKPDPFWDGAAATLLKGVVIRVIYEKFLLKPEFEDINGNVVDVESVTAQTIGQTHFPIIRGNLGDVVDFLLSNQFDMPRMAQLKFMSTVEDFLAYCEDTRLREIIRDRLCFLYPNFKAIIQNGKEFANIEEAKAESGVGNLPGVDPAKVKFPERYAYAIINYDKMNPDGSFDAKVDSVPIKWNTGGKHPEVVSAFVDSSQASENTTSTIIKVATTSIGLFALSTIRKNTAKSDFRIRDLMFYKQPISLYLVILPADIIDLGVLAKLLLVQFVNVLTPEQDYRNQVKPPHTMAMILDEFPAIGKVEVLEKAVGFMAGYGVKMMIINQSLDQLYQIYTENNMFMGNKQIQVFYTSNDNTTGKYVSEAIGNKTFRYTTGEAGFKAFGGKKNENFTGVPLMSGDRLRRLPSNKILALLGGKTPVLMDKITYFMEDRFIYWNKNIPLVGTESCYNIDRQYSYNDPIRTLVDFEFLLGDNRTKYVPYREILDEEWQYSHESEDFKKMNVFERVWLINQIDLYGKDKNETETKQNNSSDGRDVIKYNEAKFLNAYEMLKKVGYFDNKKFKNRGYEYKKVLDPMQEHRRLDTFIKVNPYDGKYNGRVVYKGDINKKNKKHYRQEYTQYGNKIYYEVEKGQYKTKEQFFIAGTNETHIPTSVIIDNCIKFYKKFISSCTDKERLKYLMSLCGDETIEELTKLIPDEVKTKVNPNKVDSDKINQNLDEDGIDYEEFSQQQQENAQRTATSTILESETINVSPSDVVDRINKHSADVNSQAYEQQELENKLKEQQKQENEVKDTDVDYWINNFVGLYYNNPNGIIIIEQSLRSECFDITADIKTKIEESFKQMRMEHGLSVE